MSNASGTGQPLELLEPPRNLRLAPRERRGRMDTGQAGEIHNGEEKVPDLLLDAVLRLALEGVAHLSQLL